MSGSHVALLRGINVGGKNPVPMKSLVEIFLEARCTDVRTYIQSGNVVFTAKDALAQRIPGTLGKALATRFGFQIPVLTRSAAELRAVVKGNPFLRAGVDPAQLHVAFLAEAPDDAARASLDPRRSPPDRFELRGREIYLHLPNGAGRSKLTNAWFDSKLATISTMRNWRTVLALLEMVSG